MAGVVMAVIAIYALLPSVALSAMPVKYGKTLLTLSKEEGGFADDPILGVVKNMDLGALQGPAEIYVGILAATILFIATNAGAARSVASHVFDGAAPAAPGAAGAAPALSHALCRDCRVRSCGLHDQRASTHSWTPS